jgi:IS30 family transposase
VKLQEIVAGKLILDCSPEQVSGWLKMQYPNDENMRVSHETIYRSLFIQARGVLKKELIQHLRFSNGNGVDDLTHAMSTKWDAGYGFP